MRRIINLNKDWLFLKGDLKVPRPKDKGPVYAQSKIERKIMGPAAYEYFDRPNMFNAPGKEPRNDGWKKVNLPHDYIIDQDNDPNENNAHGYFKYENAWYRKHFTFDEDVRGKRVLLQFGGIAGHSTVYLNGCLMKHNFSTYNSFEIDVTNNIYYDKENIIAVYSNTEEFEGWWYQGGGIYRSVKLVITEPLAIDLYGVYAPARKLDDKTWAVDFETTVVNDMYEDTQFEVESSIIDSDGTVVAVSKGKGDAPLREKQTVKYSATVNEPKLWDVDDPNLYTVKTLLYKNGEALDENTTRIGFRTIAVDPEKGFFLNGRHVKIMGVCCHGDFGLTGLAMPDNIARYRIKLLKEMGANAYRTAHYQHCDATMDALDEMGFIVMNEARWFETNDEAKEQLTTLVKRDRNRPSVVFWSTGNEEKVHITDMGQRVHKALYHLIQKLDKTRFITTAEDKEPNHSMVYNDCDVVGINYYLNLYDEVHSLFPNKPMVASECGAVAHARDWHFNDVPGRAAAWDKDSNRLFVSREKWWKAIAEKEYMMGMYQWAGIEHRGEAVWPTVCSRSGAVDLFLQKKGGFYQNKSHWTTKPMVHILPHWNFKGLEGSEIKVTVYTNCDELELFLNGKSLGRKEIEKYGRGEWDVVYIPGTLSVKGYRDGKLAAEDERVTTKSPVRLSLRLENEFKANGEDIALFTCECLDQDGRVVPDASEYVKFFTSNMKAKVIGTGSDNCDHAKVTNSERKMYMGKITIGVIADDGVEEFSLFAQSDSLGYCKLDVIPSK